MTGVQPARPRLTAADRAWLAGYAAGRGERFWHGIRRLWLPALVVSWVYVACSRRTPDLVRAVAIFAVLAALWLVVVLAPLEVVWLGVRYVRHRRRARPVADDEEPF